MIAPDGQDAALFHRAVDIENVIAGPAADIDDERAEIFLVLRQHHLRRSERGKDNVFHLERQLLHATDRVLNPRPHPMDNVEIRLEFFAEHPDRVQHAFLPIDVIMLND